MLIKHVKENMSGREWEVGGAWSVCFGVNTCVASHAIRGSDDTSEDRIRFRVSTHYGCIRGYMRVLVYLALFSPAAPGARTPGGGPLYGGRAVDMGYFLAAHFTAAHFTLAYEVR